MKKDEIFLEGDLISYYYTPKESIEDNQKKVFRIKIVKNILLPVFLVFSQVSGSYAKGKDGTSQNLDSTSIVYIQSESPEYERCYRHFKNGKEIKPTREELQAEALTERYRPYKGYRHFKNGKEVKDNNIKQQKEKRELLHTQIKAKRIKGFEEKVVLPTFIQQNSISKEAQFGLDVLQGKILNKNQQSVFQFQPKKVNNFVRVKIDHETQQRLLQQRNRLQQKKIVMIEGGDWLEGSQSENRKMTKNEREALAYLTVTFITFAFLTFNLIRKSNISKVQLRKLRIFWKHFFKDGNMFL
jgi:hypothetical protein